MDFFIFFEKAGWGCPQISFKVAGKEKFIPEFQYMGSFFYTVTVFQ